MISQLTLFGDLFVPAPLRKAGSTVINVATVPQRSPFRYAGGKTWAIPIVRKWLQQDGNPVSLLVEPFAGGGIVSVTAAAENLANQVEMVELDSEVAAVWKTILGSDNAWLIDRILTFNLSLENVKNELAKPEKTIRHIAFCTILKNRVNHGGILAPGVGMLKVGEKGKGIASRWYPETLAKRIAEIELISNKIEPIEGDGFETIIRHIANPLCYFFIDPPYVVAGKRLYTHFDINHAHLFELTATLIGRFLLTYDDTPEVRNLAEKYNLLHTTVPMKTTHHVEKREVLISDNFDWL